MLKVSTRVSSKTKQSFLRSHTPHPYLRRYSQDCIKKKKRPFFSSLVFVYAGKCVIKNINLSSPRLQLPSSEKPRIKKAIQPAWAASAGLCIPPSARSPRASPANAHPRQRHGPFRTSSPRPGPASTDLPRDSTDLPRASAEEQQLCHGAFLITQLCMVSMKVCVFKNQ